MARIAGVDLPPQKRVEIGLTYIYGIGRARANSILGRAGINLDTKVRDLNEEEVSRIFEHLAYLRLNPDRSNLESVAQKLTSALRVQVPKWIIEQEQAVSEKEEQQMTHLELAISQAETTCTNVDNIDWNDDMEAIISRLKTEVLLK